MATTKDVKNEAGFVFGEAKASDQPSKVLDLAEVRTFLVSYNDGEGKRQTRLAFKVPGAKVTFLLQEKIQGSPVATSGTAWFNEEFNRKLAEKGLMEGSEPAKSVEPL